MKCTGCWSRPLVACIRKRGKAEQVCIEGLALRLPASLAEYLGLATHELATNALKHGALSVPQGKVEAAWKADTSERQFLFDWREWDGPPVSEPPPRGFGLVTLKTIVPAVFGRMAELKWKPGGAYWHLQAPLEDVFAKGAKTPDGHGLTGAPAGSGP